MTLKVGLTYNLIRREDIEGRPLDSIAELDSEETVNAVKGALESNGHKVVLIEADLECYGKLLKSKVDIVFNIAEGLRGESRESHVPAMCEMLGIPYTGSGPLTLAICLNKARTKEILNQYNIPTPKHQVFKTPEDTLDKEMKYPLIVKLLHEGSSMGLDNDKSIVDEEKDLRGRIDYLVKTYNEPVIVEEFLEGREFTIPVLGYVEPLALPIIEVKFDEGYRINIFIPDDPVVPLVKRVKGDFKVIEAPTTSVCPAKISKALECRIKNMAIEAFKALEIRDWCRMEMRLDERGIPNVLEVNPIAGIDPSYWFPKSAKAAGISYNKLINMILDYALERYGLMEEKKWANP